MNKRSTLPRVVNLNKNQTEILELKNSINEIRNALENSGNKADQMEERICELEDRNLEMTQEKEEDEEFLKNERKKKL